MLVNHGSQVNQEQATSWSSTCGLFAVKIGPRVFAPEQLAKNKVFKQLTFRICPLFLVHDSQTYTHIQKAEIVLSST